MSRNILITGGAGFIGSHVVRLFVTKYPDYRIVNLDKLTYAGNLANLKDIEQAENYSFERCDICDYEQVLAIFRKYRIDGVIHLAAESHVDRSIKDPFTFARTNVMGTLSLLQSAGTAIGRGNSSTISRPTRFTAHCSSTARSLRRRPNTIRIRPTRHRKLRPTISCGRSTIPTECRRW